MVGPMKKVASYTLAFIVLGIPALFLILFAAIFLVALSCDILIFQGPKALVRTYVDAWKDRNRYSRKHIS